MSSYQSPGSDRFWSIIKQLEELTSPLSVDKFCQNLGIGQVELYRAIHFYQIMKVQFVVKEIDQLEMIVPPTEIPKIYIEMSLTEWLSFQGHFPVLDQVKDSLFHQILVDRLVNIERCYQEYDFFEAYAALEMDDSPFKIKAQINLVDAVEPEVKSIFNDMPDIYQTIEKSLAHQEVLSISLKDGKTFQFFPHKIVHLGGNLHLIGEDLIGACLLYFDMDQINKVVVYQDKSHTPLVTSKEVEQFIEGMREIDGNTIRLILKITNPQNDDLVPLFQFLGKPALISNPKGEVIWAATIEPGEELFNWLYQLGSSVKIIDPLNFKQDFDRHVQENFKKSA